MHTYAGSLELIEMADVLLQPSKAEGFGMPVLEAQLLGTPVVTTKFGAMADFTKYGVTPARHEPRAVWNPHYACITAVPVAELGPRVAQLPRTYRRGVPPVFTSRAEPRHRQIAVPPLQPHFLVRGWCAMPHLDGVVDALQQVSRLPSLHRFVRSSTVYADAPCIPPCYPRRVTCATGARGRAATRKPLARA